MKKLSLDCLVGDEVYLSYFGQQIEGFVKEINETFYILDVKPEFVDSPLISTEMGFSIDFINESNKD